MFTYILPISQSDRPLLEKSRTGGFGEKLPFSGHKVALIGFSFIRSRYYHPFFNQNLKYKEIKIFAGSCLREKKDMKHTNIHIFIHI